MSSPHPTLLVRVAALGLATGLRSTSGLTAVVARRGGAGDTRFPRALRLSMATAFCGELVWDKLPTAGSRLAPPALAARVVCANLAAVAVVRRADRSLLPAMVVASVAALAGAKAGHDLRQSLSHRFPDLLVALAEDAVTVGLASVGSMPVQPVNVGT